MGLFFLETLPFLQQIYVKNVHPESNPRPLEHESPPFYLKHPECFISLTVA